LSQKININNSIRAAQLRIIDATGVNLGVMTKDDALSLAKAKGLDLVEINATSNPPIAKIVDYGKYQYESSKKEKKAKENSHRTETKVVQIKSGTGEHDLLVKAKAASKWLKEGHRVKIDLQLRDRTKYMGEEFMKERMDRILHFITENFKIADPYKRSPKAYSITIERSKATKEDKAA
jgi:translation initiation factor IF-3